MSWSTLFWKKATLSIMHQGRDWGPGPDRPLVGCSRASWLSVRRTEPTLLSRGGAIVDILLSFSSSSFWTLAPYPAHWSPFTHRPPSGATQTPCSAKITWRPPLWTFGPAPHWRGSCWPRRRTSIVCPTAWMTRMICFLILT